MKDKEKYKAQQLEYRLKNKEKIKEYHSRYNKENREKLAKQKAEYFEKNKEVLKAKRKIYISENREKRSHMDYIRYIKYAYKITYDEYLELLNKQNHKCAICELPISEHRKKLFIDHDHITGQVRGLLCMKCNSGLGLFSDDYNLLEKAAKYLKSTKN